MTDQTRENNVSVYVNSEYFPAVTGVHIMLRREMADKLMPATTFAMHRITIQRYLPVGVSVENLYAKHRFSLMISDAWNTMTFHDCEWYELNREETLDGVTETLIVLSESMSLL